jgi:hypothetical protein
MDQQFQTYQNGGQVIPKERLLQNQASDPPTLDLLNNSNPPTGFNSFVSNNSPYM